uniref:Uncharacterized protein n=1 Tax=Populus alba TaxID=43335 RepID=A0A4U5Q7D1_POPAL|nr:hypothetical protein D5086_0000130170 [Populus alba]
MMWMQFSIKLDNLEPLEVLWRILINLQVEEALLELVEYYSPVRLYHLLLNNLRLLFTILFSGLKSIRKSECPKELEPADRRSSVHDNLTRRDQNCPAWGCSELSAAVDGIPSEASYLSNSQKIEQADLSSLVVIQKL